MFYFPVGSKARLSRDLCKTVLLGDVLLKQDILAPKGEEVEILARPEGIEDGPDTPYFLSVGCVARGSFLYPLDFVADGLYDGIPNMRGALHYAFDKVDEPINLGGVRLYYAGAIVEDGNVYSYILFKRGGKWFYNAAVHPANWGWHPVSITNPLGHLNEVVPGLKEDKAPHLFAALRGVK